MNKPLAPSDKKAGDSAWDACGRGGHEDRRTAPSRHTAMRLRPQHIVAQTKSAFVPGQSREPSKSDTFRSVSWLTGRRLDYAFPMPCRPSGCRVFTAACSRSFPLTVAGSAAESAQIGASLHSRYRYAKHAAETACFVHIIARSHGKAVNSMLSKIGPVADNPFMGFAKLQSCTSPNDSYVLPTRNRLDR